VLAIPALIASFCINTVSSLRSLVFARGFAVTLQRIKKGSLPAISRIVISPGPVIEQLVKDSLSKVTSESMAA
jgi:hypothetical protein